VESSPVIQGRARRGRRVPAARRIDPAACEPIRPDQRGVSATV